MKKMARILKEDVIRKQAALEDTDVDNAEDYIDAFRYKEEQEYLWKDLYFNLRMLANNSRAARELAEDVKLNAHNFGRGGSNPKSVWAVNDNVNFLGWRNVMLTNEEANELKNIFGNFTSTIGYWDSVKSSLDQIDWS